MTSQSALRWGASDVQPWGPTDASAMQSYADELQARFERMQEQGPALHDKAQAVQVTEKSRDGLISVTVGARGELVRLDIDPRIYRRPDSRALADTIAATIKAAAATAQERVLEIFEPLVGREEMSMHLSGDLDGVLEKMAAAMLGKR